MIPKFKGKPLQVERAERRAALVAHERAEKAKVRQRDRNRCRWPRCEYVASHVGLEVAHLEAKGMGGDKRGTRTQAHKMVVLCRLHHQGIVSLHSGDLKVRPLTERGTDGPCEFLATVEGDRLTVVGREQAVGILERA